jgi:putative DNA primase/helicase
LSRSKNAAEDFAPALLDGTQEIQDMGDEDCADAEALTSGAGTPSLTTAHVAHQLLAEHGEEFRYLTDRRVTFAFRDGKWQADAGDRHNLTHILFRAAHELCMRLYEESSAPSRAKVHLLNAQFPKDVAAMTAALVEHMAFADKFDLTPDLLGLPDGLVCELRTGHIRAAQPRDYVSKSVAVTPDSSAAPERFLRFVDEVTSHDAELKKYLLRLLGYCCTGEMSEEFFGFWTGTGANGKSALCDNITSILGDYVATLSVKLLAAGGAQDSENEMRTMAHLCGARVAFASESSHRLKVDIGLAKKLAAPEKLLGRFLYENSFAFSPTHKLVVSAQELQFEKLDYAIERRLHVVEFRQKFCRPETIAEFPGALPIDKKIWTQLRAERGGILALLLNEARAWYADGLLMPQIVLDSRARYFAEHDTFGAWLSGECFRDPDAFTATQTLYDNYKAVANAMGTEEVMHIGPFAKALMSRGFKDGRSRVNGRQFRGFFGLRLKNETEQQ